MPKKSAQLRFENLDQARQYVERLEGCETKSGNWSVSEIYEHCSLALECTLTGFPALYPLPIRRTLGAVSALGILRLGFFPPAVPNIRAVPQISRREDTESARRRLIAAILSLKEAAEIPHEHPFFGRLQRSEWYALHSYHLAHHLAYIVPPVDGNQVEPRTGRTALMEAIIGNMEGTALRELISRSRPDLTDQRGQTALHHAILEGHLDAARWLLEAGANPNARDQEGVTPLNLCRSLGGTGDFSRLLLEYGANPNLTDNKGKTYQM